MTEVESVALRRGVEMLMAQFETEPVHVLHVRDLALALFDGLGSAHGLSSDDRAFLDVSACLHDIGWFVTQPDGKGHHRETARLIREHAWPGVRRESVEFIALVARYHRKSIPSEKTHDDFAALPGKDRVRVRWLAGLLRVADGLDRRHLQAVETVGVTQVGRVIRITVSGMDALTTEVTGALKKADLLEEISGCRVEIEGTER